MLDWMIEAVKGWECSNCLFPRKPDHQLNEHQGSCSNNCPNCWGRYKHTEFDCQRVFQQSYLACWKCGSVSESGKIHAETMFRVIREDPCEYCLMFNCEVNYVFRWIWPKILWESRLDN